MATATVIESYMNDFFNSIQAKPNTIFCDICKNFFWKKVIEKYVKINLI